MRTETYETFLTWEFKVLLSALIDPMTWILERMALAIKVLNLFIFIHICVYHNVYVK